MPFPILGCSSTLLHTRTDSHFFYAPPNVDQTGCECEALRQAISGLKSRFIALLMQIYPDVTTSGLAQIGTEPFDQLNIAFFTGRQQAKNLPLDVPFFFNRRQNL